MILPVAVVLGILHSVKEEKRYTGIHEETTRGQMAHT